MSRRPIDADEREACAFPYAMCGAVREYREGIVRCNRAEGHAGDHVAAAGRSVVVARWGQVVLP